VKTSVEPLEGNKVKVSVEVDESEFEHDLDKAFKRIAREVRIPGFRPGKAPRRIIESRIGVGPAREDALRQSLPDYYAQAVREHDIDVVAAPEIDITAGEEEGPVAFDAVVEVRPVVIVGGYASLRVTVERPEATEDDITAQIDRLREQASELVAVDRPAADGDHVSIDITGKQNDEEQAGLTADDYLYEVGTGAVVPELDDELRGAKVGDILEFTAAHPDPDEDPIDFRVLVKAVKEKVLPEVTDEWADENSEFSTVEELRTDIATRAALVKQVRAQMQFRERTAAALAELVTEELSESLVGQEVQTRLQDLAMRLQAQGMGIEQYLQFSGRSVEDLMEELKVAADEAVRVDLALRAVAEAEELDISDEELEDEIVHIAGHVNEKPDKVRRQLERNDQLPLVRSDLRKKKALDWLLEHVEVVDDEGEPVDRALLETDDEHDHDHDHDHGDDGHDHSHATESEEEHA
jgi:trigger factor